MLISDQPTQNNSDISDTLLVGKNSKSLNIINLCSELSNIFIQFCYRLAVIFTPCLRETLLKVRARLVPVHDVTHICNKTTRGDWFILYQLGKNIDPVIYKEFLIKLYDEMVANNNGYARQKQKPSKTETTALFNSLFGYKGL